MWQHDGDAGNLRRSTRKRRVLVHVDYESDNSDHELYRSQTTRVRIALGLLNRCTLKARCLGSEVLRFPICWRGNFVWRGLSSGRIGVFPFRRSGRGFELCGSYMSGIAGMSLVVLNWFFARCQNIDILPPALPRRSPAPRKRRARSPRRRKTRMLLRHRGERD